MKPLYLIVLSLLVAPSHPLAETNVTATNVVALTPAFINLLAEQMRTNSPALRAADARLEAARAHVASVRTWEDPKVLVGGMFADTEMRSSEGDLIYGADQKLPLFGKPARARRLAREEAGVAEAETDLRFQAQRQALATALFRVAYAQRAAGIGDEDLRWLDAMVSTTAERYRVGEAAQVYLLRLQNERARRADQLLTDRRRILEEQATVNRLLGRDIDTAWPALALPAVAGDVPYDQRLIELALLHEPRLLVLRQQVQQADAAVAVARRQHYPDVSAGVENRNYTGTGGWRQTMVVLSVSLPWLNDGKYRQDVRRESWRQDAAELDLRDAELAVREELRRLTTGIDAARREALLYRDEVIPRSTQALASAQAAWMANRAVFLDVMDTRRMLIESQLAYARAVTEQWRLLSELVLCCGLGDLEALSMIVPGFSAAPPPLPSS